MEQETLLLEPSKGSSRRGKKKGGCLYWIAPSIVVFLIAYGLVVALWGCVGLRWNGVWPVQVVMALLFAGLGTMILWSFCAAVFTLPGYNETDEFLKLPAYRNRSVVDPGNPADDYDVDVVRWCKKCEIHKPDRTHHCSQAGACVLRMDHFCPWVNQTVGQRNHKHFFLFLFWGSIMCTFASVVLILSLVFRPPQFNFDQWSVWDFQMAWVGFYTAVFALTLIVFGAQHLFQILTNCTTLENFKSTTRWTRGTKTKNWEEVMGTRFPFLPTPLVGGGDGYHFGGRGNV